MIFNFSLNSNLLEFNLLIIKLTAFHKKENVNIYFFQILTINSNEKEKFI